MKRLLGPVALPVAFVLTAALAFAGLGWLTVVALRVERAQLAAAAEAEQGNKLRVALWQLDGSVLLQLGGEDNRPFHHYSSADPLAGPTAGPTPLLAAQFPDWMKLHVQLDPATGWESPQALTPEARARVAAAWPELPLRNDTPDRAAALSDLRLQCPAAVTCGVLAARDRGIPDGAPPFAAPLFATEPGAPASASQPPPQPGSVSGPPSADALRLFGWEFRRRDPLAANPRNENAPPRDPVPGQALLPPVAQGQAPFFGRGPIRATDGDRGRNDFQNRAQAIQRGSQEAKSANVDPMYGRNYLNPQSGNDLRNDRDGKGGFAPDALTSAGGAVLAAACAVADGAACSSHLVSPNEGRPGLPPPTFGQGNFGNAAGNNTPVPPPVVNIHLGSMRPQWLAAADGSELLVLMRVAKLDARTLYQGVLLDWPKLERLLLDEVKELFPAARLVPVTTPDGVPPGRAMTALPVQLDPGPEPERPPAGWTPLRLGLAVAWVAAGVACLAVGLSGWSLVDLAERRIRFVSAVTHELRTPLTSLRLYLDLLTSGMIHDEAKRQEYLNTLAAESERLHRLVDNVLDFAKLEKRRASGDLKPVLAAELLDQFRQTWSDRLAADGMELVVVSTLPPGLEVCTDAAVVGQIVGNLIDNARKYARDAADRRVWLWARPDGGRRVVFEVEDRGPGVPVGERKSIFKPFRRGSDATATGGAGLGLALAKQWAAALGGVVAYRPAGGAPGACFRLELPV